MKNYIKTITILVLFLVCGFIFSSGSSPPIQTDNVNLTEIKPNQSEHILSVMQDNDSDIVSISAIVSHLNF